MRVYKVIRKQDGRLAQLEEHLVYTERVGSSNLSAPTNKKTTREGGFFCWFEGLRFELPRKGVRPPIEDIPIFQRIRQTK